jgi:hypothetical protein
MAEFLTHPLVVLLVGAVITGLLIPWLTHGWQNRQKELEIKTGLVSDISESTMTILKRIEAVQVLRTGLPQDASNDNAAPEDERKRGIKRQFQEAFDTMNQASQDFAIQSAVIRTKLQAYLPEVSSNWSDFSDVVLRLYALEGIRGEQGHKHYKEELRQKLSGLLSPGTLVGEDWVEIRDQVLKIEDVLIQQILKSRIPFL